MNSKSAWFVLIILVTWILSIWISYWSGFYKHSEISNFIDEDSQITQLMDHKFLLKKLNDGRTEEVKKALTERISLEVSIIDALDANRDESGWSLWHLIYPREALTLIAIKDKRESEKKGRVKESE